MSIEILHIFTIPYGIIQELQTYYEKSGLRAVSRPVRFTCSNLLGVVFMMNYVWAGLVLVSIMFGACTGRMQQVTEAVYSGGTAAVEMALTLAAVMMVWGGIMRIAEGAGVTGGISRLLSPVLGFLFPGLKKDGPAARAISMNVSANLLGLGNAATPFGIEAMKRLQEENPLKDTASRNMITFVVLNTASIQLIPTTIAGLRAKYGSLNPMDIMPAIWLASAIALVAGQIINRILAAHAERRRRPCR